MFQPTSFQRGCKINLNKGHVSTICNLPLNEEKAVIALAEFKLINTTDEMRLLLWLVQFEDLYTKIKPFDR